MIEYVLGFRFSTDHKQVLLQLKTKGPRHLVNKLNGVGGKVEFLDRAESWFTGNQFAMARECFEETGINTEPQEWKQVATLVDRNTDGYKLHIFASVGALSKEINDSGVPGMEPVGVFDVGRYPRSFLAPHVEAYIALALETLNGFHEFVTLEVTR